MTEAQDELTQARARLAELETALTEATQAETDAETVIATKAAGRDGRRAQCGTLHPRTRHGQRRALASAKRSNQRH